MGYSATGTFETFGVNSLSEPTWDKKEHFEIKQNTKESDFKDELNI